MCIFKIIIRNLILKCFFYLCSRSLLSNADDTHYLCLDHDNDGDITAYAF